MKCRTIMAALLLGAVAFQAPPAHAQHDAELRKKAAEIRTSANQLFKLQRIPWITDPAEGFRLAQEENRPVFLYIQAGDPLEDC